MSNRRAVFRSPMSWLRKRLVSDAALLTIIAATIVAPLAAQTVPIATGIVRGQVKSADAGQPVVGVQVFVPTTQIGTVTDENGRYVLRNVPVGSTKVQTRYVGYSSATQTTSVSATVEATLDFSLARSTIQLDQVVVTGTPGATEKRAIGNAVASVDLASIVKTSPAPNITNLLKGRAAGVTTLSQGGSIGAGSAIRIRGAGSISLSNAPLIYVDGVRLDNTSGTALNAGVVGSSSRLDDINANDIESIEIIKGPAAATLYGTEASNGVVQIITKKGAAGVNTTTIQLRTGVNYLADAAHVFPLNWYTPAGGVPVSQNLVETEKAAGRDVFRTGQLQQVDLQADGGNQSARYFLSGSYLSNEGIYTNNYMHRFSTRANVNANLSPTLAVQGNLAFVQSTNPSMPEAATANFGLVPMIVFGSPASITTRLRGFLRAPPEASETIDQTEDINRTTVGMSATFTPETWFTSRLNTGLDLVSQKNGLFFPFDPNGYFGALSTGNKAVYQYTRRNVSLDWAATGKYQAPADILFATSVGVQFYDRTNTTVSGTSQNFPSPGLETLSSGAVTTSGETFVENKTLGGYAQEEFSSKNRRFITVALRGDANSAFGDQYKPAYYPKVSGAWVLSEEGLHIPSVISQLRLRGAFGYSGLQPDALAAVRTYTPVAGTGGQAAILPASPGNGTIRPERSQETEIGFDADMFSGRAGIVFSYFRKRTNDAIVAVPSAPSTGFAGSEFKNLGQVTNKGYEIEANVIPISRKNLQWSIGANLTHVTNIVNSLGGSPTINTGQGFNTIMIKEGYPIGSFFAKKVLSADRTATNTATNVLCDDGTGKGIACASAPQVFLADPGPGYELSVHSSIRLGRGLTFSGNADGQFDTHLYSSMLYARRRCVPQFVSRQSPGRDADYGDCIDCDWIERAVRCEQQLYAFARTVVELRTPHIFHAQVSGQPHHNTWRFRAQPCLPVSQQGGAKLRSRRGAYNRLVDSLRTRTDAPASLLRVFAAGDLLMQTFMMNAKRRRNDNRRLATSAVLFAALIALAACNDPLGVTLPGTVTPSNLDTPAAAPLLVNSAVSAFECAHTQYVMLSANLGDEYLASSSAEVFFTFDQRAPSLPDFVSYATQQCSQTGSLYVPLSQARFLADDAFNRINAFADTAVTTRALKLATAAAYAGYSYTEFGEGFCTAAFDLGPELQPKAVLAIAEDRFTKALQWATTAGATTAATDIANMSYVGRARVRLDLGNTAGALADAQLVPAGYVKNAARSSGDATLQNKIYNLGTLSAYFTVDTSFQNVKFAGVADPRRDRDQRKQERRRCTHARSSSRPSIQQSARPFQLHVTKRRS